MSLPGVQGHTDTLGGGGLLSKCHSSPWNRKGWFCSNRHGSWRQSPGRLTGGLSLLGTSARDSTTSNSTKGAVESGAADCQQGHGRGCRSSLLLPFPSPRGLGSAMLRTGLSPAPSAVYGTTCQAWQEGPCPHGMRRSKTSAHTLGAGGTDREELSSTRVVCARGQGHGRERPECLCSLSLSFLTCKTGYNKHGGKEGDEAEGWPQG